jgi:hypothetical protein
LAQQQIWNHKNEKKNNFTRNLQNQHLSKTLKFHSKLSNNFGMRRMKQKTGPQVHSMTSTFLKNFDILIKTEVAFAQQELWNQEREKKTSPQVQSRYQQCTSFFLKH